jgi:2-haloacid dehalogenase
MRWAALYRRLPILRGVSASPIRADHAAKQARIGSLLLNTSTGVVLSARISLLMAECSIAVFDLGGVLIDWNPRYLYRKLFAGDAEAMEEFLATVCTQSWNEQQDAGRPFAEACDPLKLVHPHKARLIDAWVLRYDEMLAGPISGTVDILTKLNSHRVPLYALSNWSVETFPVALKRFEFLKWFRRVMLSGEVKLLKPDPRIFKLFLETFAIDPALAVYIDDREPNVEAAIACGMHGILFTDAATLRTDLIGLGLFR